jgi:biotin synthase-related radical SAM superfamily protein
MYIIGDSPDRIDNFLRNLLLGKVSFAFYQERVEAMIDVLKTSEEEAVKTYLEFLRDRSKVNKLKTAIRQVWKHFNIDVVTEVTEGYHLTRTAITLSVVSFPNYTWLNDRCLWHSPGWRL